MYYEIHGSGEPLVLIHGGSTIYTSFGRILPSLANTYRVIALELQAHGHTADRNMPESFEQDADDVAALLRQLNIAGAYVLGFSNGGSTALQLTIRHPDLVSKIIAISAMCQRAGMYPWFWEMMEKATFGDMPQLYKDAFLRINPNEELLLNMFHIDRQRMLSFRDWEPASIQSIQIPVWVIVSDQDVVRPEHALEISRLLPRGILSVFPGGHEAFMGEAMSPHTDSKIPELFVALLEVFLAGNL